MSRYIVELADDWHPRGYRCFVTAAAELPDRFLCQRITHEDGTFFAFDDAGAFVRTGTADDGVPVYAWMPFTEMEKAVLALRNALRRRDGDG